MIEMSLILLCLIMVGACGILSITLHKETKARTIAEEQVKYWRTIAQDNGQGKSKYYVGLRECYEKSRELYAFIGQRYHGEA